jgi:hypothetical protein
LELELELMKQTNTTRSLETNSLGSQAEQQQAPLVLLPATTSQATLGRVPDISLVQMQGCKTLLQQAMRLGEPLQICFKEPMVMSIIMAEMLVLLPALVQVGLVHMAFQNTRISLYLIPPNLLSNEAQQPQPSPPKIRIWGKTLITITAETQVLQRLE